MNRRTITFSLALGLALALTGVSTAAAGSLDTRNARVAQAAPAFGGMFVDDGVLNVYMTNRGAPARAAASRAIRRSSDLPHTVRVLKARYRFAQLDAWQQRATAKLLGRSGVVMTDVDDRTNRVTVGVTGDSGRRAVRARLAALGIPREAVRISETAPTDQLSSLNDFHRPLVGGLQTGSFAPCTLGFNVVRKGVPGFIVNSHCTNIQGSIEGSLFVQPDLTSVANLVGVEAVDPVYFKGGMCPPNRRCRYSDTAFVKRDSGVPASQGFIAKSDPSPSTGWNGDLYRITGRSDAIVGQFVEKVGRTTGRTSAPVDGTCRNVVVNNTNIILLCQNTAQLFSQPGDSGSPVFTPNGSDATLRGELWGGTVSTGQSIFAPITSIQRSTEMGPLTVCAPGFSC